MILPACVYGSLVVRSRRLTTEGVGEGENKEGVTLYINNAYENLVSLFIPFAGLSALFHFSAA